MNEFHPSESAVGAHFDEELEITALAQRFYEEEGRPEGRSLEHWLRAEREIHARRRTDLSEGLKPGASQEDSRTEEAMHLGQ